MITKLCIWFLRMRNVPVMLNIQLVDDVVVTIPNGKTLYHTRQLQDSGKLLAIQEESETLLDEMRGERYDRQSNFTTCTDFGD